METKTFNMAANYNLNTFITQASSVTPSFFFHNVFCRVVSNIWGELKKICEAKFLQCGNTWILAKIGSTDLEFFKIVPYITYFTTKDLMKKKIGGH